MRRWWIVALSFCVSFGVTAGVLLATPRGRDFLARRGYDGRERAMIRVRMLPAPASAPAPAPEDVPRTDRASPPAQSPASPVAT